MLNQLRQLMKQDRISVYVIPTGDDHDSEYAGEYFEVRKFLSGFTGSAGTLVVGTKEAALFTDGRYFVQAARELEGSGIQLMRMGEPGVPTVEEYIGQLLEQDSNLGVYGRLISFATGRQYEKIAREKSGSLVTNGDLAGSLWTDRPPLKFHEIRHLEDRYTGETVSSKLSRLRGKMKELGADSHLLTTLDDIAWLFNFRGQDIPCNPVVYAFALILPEKEILYMEEGVLTEEDRKTFATNHVEIRPYESIYQNVYEIQDHQVLVDPMRANETLVSCLAAHNQIVEAANPTTLMKAVKNFTELENTRRIHLADGAAVTRFMYWLKTNAPSEEITEVEASDYLDNLRAQIPGYLDLSFDTISAYGANAAMMHYNARTGNNALIRPGGMLLVDSGGQYLEGTTDITRTIVIGEIPEKMKLHFTTVAQSMLRLANARFLYGCSGLNLDILAREPLWKLGMDYKCGTGHGVGHILNVHEGPNAFRWKILNNTIPATLEEGMITTDEPGVYLEGQYGIRTENELVCRKIEENGDGTFMGFEPLTFAPIDLDGIDPSRLEPEDKKMLNAYHQMVYEKISPLLEPKEQQWLKEYTREI